MLRASVMTATALLLLLPAVAPPAAAEEDLVDPVCSETVPALCVRVVKHFRFGSLVPADVRNVGALVYHLHLGQLRVAVDNSATPQPIGIPVVVPDLRVATPYADAAFGPADLNRTADKVTVTYAQVEALCTSACFVLAPGPVPGEVGVVYHAELIVTYGGADLMNVPFYLPEPTPTTADASAGVPTPEQMQDLLARLGNQ